MDRIEKFIEALSQEVSTPTLTNAYSPLQEQGNICRHNLSVYLHKVMEHNSKVMLIGEAPSFHGCRLSGIPFTCEYDFTREVIPSLMGKGEGYEIFSKNQPEHELSASIVWSKLQKWYENYGTLPLLWNICPFHPHKADNHLSNRTPTGKEVERGMNYLLQLVELFDIQHIGCIGRKSEKAVQTLGFPHTYLRHPSCGGVHMFRDMMDEFTASYQNTLQSK